VNVVATRQGGFVQGLSRGDFAVAEDDVPQEIAFFGAETTPFAVAILLDTSGSMEDKLPLARAAAARFMDRTRPEDRVAMYAFSSDVRRLQDFIPGQRDLAEALWETNADGRTKMYDCLEEAAAALAGRPEHRRAILLVSDGADNGSRTSLDAVVQKALGAGITLYTMDLAPICRK